MILPYVPKESGIVGILALEFYAPGHAVARLEEAAWNANSSYRWGLEDLK
jgi:hypothetical protein